MSKTGILLLFLKSLKYINWSFHCVIILIASSMNVTTMRNRPMAGKYLDKVSFPFRRLSRLLNPLHQKMYGSWVVHSRTYGFTGSATLFKKSSILLVCSRIWSRGLGSLVALSLLWPPNWLLFTPRLYPAVPRICAMLIVDAVAVQSLRTVRRVGIG